MKVNATLFIKTREDQLLSVLALANKAELSPKVIKRLEEGKPVRLISIRKVLAGLGLSLADAKSMNLIE
jgi:ribosome-binding protein aMBF1 (putative translation factor)